MSSQDFANELTIAWHKESSKVNFSEVKQFRALMDSFAALKSNFDIEEFHGMKHQVIFNGEGAWKRTPARCEISDLLVVSYDNNHTTPQIRVTFIQAKKSDEKHSLCQGWPNKISQTSFKANLEQWDLLSRRPHVLPHKPFHCNPNVLKDAILPSIGSIIVFHKISSKENNLFYISADKLTPLSLPKTRFAKLKTLTGNTIRTIQGHKERVFACCITTFAESLYNLEIGTPIHKEDGLTVKEDLYRKEFRQWIGNIIFTHVKATKDSDSIEKVSSSERVMQFLEIDNYEDIENPPALLVLNNNNKNNE